MKLSTIVLTVALATVALVNPVQASTHHHRHYSHTAPHFTLASLFSVFGNARHHRARLVSLRIRHMNGSHITPVAYHNSGQECGVASWYSLPRNRMANGQRMNPGAMTIAHKYLPLGSRVRVTNRDNGASAIVTTTDRGPYIRGRIADLTPAVAHVLGVRGLGNVCIAQI